MNKGGHQGTMSQQNATLARTGSNDLLRRLVMRLSPKQQKSVSDAIKTLPTIAKNSQVKGIKEARAGPSNTERKKLPPPPRTTSQGRVKATTAPLALGETPPRAQRQGDRAAENDCEKAGPRNLRNATSTPLIVDGRHPSVYSQESVQGSEATALDELFATIAFAKGEDAAGMLRKSQLPARTSSKRGLEGSRAVGQEDLDSRGDEEPPWDAASAQEGAAEGAEEKVGLLNRVLFEEPEEEEDQDVETNEVRSRIMHRLDDLLHGLSPTSEPDSVARQLYPTASATNNPDGTALAALVGPHEHEEGEQDPFDAIAEILLEYTDPAETNTDTCPATNTLDCFRIVELVDTAGNRISVLNPADTPARHPHKEHKSFRISVALQSSPASSANSNSSSPRAPRIVSMLRYRLVTAIGAPRLSSPEEPSTGTYSELLASGMKLLPGLWGTGGTATAAAAAAESVTAVRRVERRGSVRVVSVDLVSPPALCAREVEEVEEEVEDEEEFEGQGLVVGSVDSEIMKPFRLLEVRKVGFVRQERTSSLNRS